MPSEGRAGAGEFLMSEIMMMVVLMITKLMMTTLMMVVLTVAMEDNGGDESGCVNSSSAVPSFVSSEGTWVSAHKTACVTYFTFGFSLV